MVWFDDTGNAAARAEHNIIKLSQKSSVAYAAKLDKSTVVELKLNENLRPCTYYLSSLGYGGTAFMIPEPGEYVGMIYFHFYEVPEPSTNTLSLLTLAVLAARRRKR